MKKEQMLYIGIGLLLVFVFMLVSTNNKSLGSSFKGYSFNGGLANSAGRLSGRRQEGFLSGVPVNSDNSNWKLQEYLDNNRGAQCAGKSFGITASGGPVCLTPEQARAMTSRGNNTDESGCLKNIYG
jgi:hypothetical protein